MPEITDNVTRKRTFFQKPSNVVDKVYTLSTIKNHILFKLHWKRYWGGKHTALESVKKGVPNHLRGRYLDLGKDLIKEGFILSKPTSYGLHISLNPDRREEIIKRVENFAL